MFNNEMFIMQMKKRPCLWNVKDVLYLNREHKKQSWKEVAQFMNALCRSCSHSNKNLTVSDVQRKWKHLRDYYKRERKRGSRCRDTEPDSLDCRRCSVAQKKRKAPLLDMLQFLDVNRGYEIIDISMDGLSGEENTSRETKSEHGKDLEEEPTPRKIPKIEEQVPENELNESTEDCSEKQFLDSLLPIMKNMSANENVDFRSRLLKTLANSIETQSTEAESEALVQSLSASQEDSPLNGINEEGIKITAENGSTCTSHTSHEIEEVNKRCINTEATLKRDEFSIYGEYVANKLRNIPNQQARNTAEFHINSILYKAHIGEYDSVTKNSKEHTSVELKEVPERDFKIEYECFETDSMSSN